MNTNTLHTCICICNYICICSFDLTQFPPGVVQVNFIMIGSNIDLNMSHLSVSSQVCDTQLKYLQNYLMQNQILQSWYLTDLHKILPWMRSDNCGHINEQTWLFNLFKMWKSEQTCVTEKKSGFRGHFLGRDHYYFDNCPVSWLLNV